MNISLGAKCIHVKSYFYTYIEVEKKILKPSVAGIRIFQEKWDIFIVADALAPRIARPSVLTKSDKRPIPAESYHYACTWL